MSDKVKIVWLCAHSGEQTLAHVRRWRKPSSSYGSWIADLLRGFQDDARYEIHVLFYTLWQRKREEHWVEHGIHYHSYQYGVPYFGCSFPSFFPFDLWTRCWLNRRRIRRIVDRIQPAFIHLFGAENMQYACVIPELSRKYAIVNTLQGFISREVSFHPDTLAFRMSCESERAALSATRVFTGEPDSINYVSSLLNRPIKSYMTYFPIDEKMVDEVRGEGVPKKYDCAFVARICKQKGIVDYLRMVKTLRDEGLSELRAVVAGPFCSCEMFEAFCQEADLDPSSVDYLGRLPTQRDVYRLLASTRVYVIPTYNDAFPTTVRESMMLGAAVIAYRTGGIPYANANGEEPNIALCDQGDVNGLVAHARLLLTDSNACMQQIRRAESHARKTYSLASNVATVRQAYEDVVRFSKGVNANEL